MRKLVTTFLGLAFALTTVLADALAQEHGSESGLKVPRFVSLKVSEANIRTGPGTRYPIRWVYRREGWPLEVIEEFDQWRRIQDVDGAKGWIHRSMLDGKRTAVLLGDEPVTLLSDPDEGSRAVVKAEPRVVGELEECEKEWCELTISSRSGWLRKSDVWGVYPEETF